MAFSNKCLLVVSTVFLVILTSCTQTTNHHHKISEPNHSERMGTHGMLLFGDSKNIYISHLPLFNHPHDMQVIAKVTVNHEVMPQLSLWLKKQDSYLTLVPEIFDLNLVAKNFHFTGSIYDGHFERQGSKVIDAANFEIEQLYENKVLSNTVNNGLIEYRHLQSERDNRHFYYRVINGRPAADHIIEVNAPLIVKKSIRIKASHLYAKTIQLAAALDVQPSSLQNIYLEVNELH